MKSQTISDAAQVKNNLVALSELCEKLENSYVALLSAEYEKRDAIRERDGSALESASRREDEILKEVEYLDTRRDMLIRDLAVEYDQPVPSTLSEITEWGNIPDRISNELSEKVSRLQALVERLKSKHELNRRLLTDCNEFFESLLGAFREEEISGYGYNNGTKAKPVMIDSSC